MIPNLRPIPSTNSTGVPRNDQYAADHFPPVDTSTRDRLDATRQHVEELASRFPEVKVDTDRIALSAALAELASRCAIESTLWADVDAKRNLQRMVGVYNVMSRDALHQLDMEVGYAYLDAGDVLIRQVESARRFLTVVDTPPMVRIPGAPQVFGWRCSDCSSTIESTSRDELRARVFNHMADCEH